MSEVKEFEIKTASFTSEGGDFLLKPLNVTLEAGEEGRMEPRHLEPLWSIYIIME